MKGALLSCAHDGKRAKACPMPRIAICAPATTLDQALAQRVEAYAKAHFPAIELNFHPQCFLSEGHFAGSDSVRLAAFLECANDASFDAVWFAKGGYGSNRIIEGAIQGLEAPAHQKAYLGYSDCGFLLAALQRHSVGQSLHGPMPVDMGRSGGEAAVKRSLAWFAGDLDGLEPSLDDKQPVVALNLTTLAMMLGSEHMPDLTGHVVIVEEVAEHLYAIDRLFSHITANLRGCAGIRLGEVTNVPENDRPFGASAEEIARDWCARYAIPFLGRAKIGHSADNHIVPFLSPL